jgi:(hydroxyamino)benzene mutase
VRKTLARAAAWLFLLALLTGGLIPSCLNGSLPFDPQTLLASHLSALMGCFLLLGVASTLPLLRYGPRGQRRLGWAFIVANYGNWSITILKARLHVHGLAWTGDAANDTIFALLTVFVVAPSLAAGLAWIYGLYGSAHE